MSIYWTEGFDKAGGVIFSDVSAFPSLECVNFFNDDYIESLPPGGVVALS